MRSMDRFYVRQLVRSLFLLSLLATTKGIQLSIGVEHDMTQPTYGLQGRSSSSLAYNDREGLKMSGTVNDILGPPVKIAQGFKQMLTGSGMTGIGSSMKSGSAVLGVDAKLLEAAGGASMLKGGLLMGGAAAKVGAATVAGGLPGKKIASIIELPVKVVAMKDLAAGKTMYGLGRIKQQQAQESNTKGENMIREGQSLKKQGMNQMMQGASEGMQNIGNMFQQTAENAATAFKFLPIIMDMPTPNSSSSSGSTKGEPVQQQQQEQDIFMPPQSASSSSHAKAGGASSSITGGSLFGGLGSLVPGLTHGTAGSSSASAYSGSYGGAGSNKAGSTGGHNAGQSSFENLFAPNHNGYAAVLNATNPFTNYIMNPLANPFLLPFNNNGHGSNLMFEGGSSLSHGSSGSKSPYIGPTMGGQQSSTGSGHSTTSHFNLLPGLKITEKSSSISANEVGVGKTSGSGKTHVQQQEQQQEEKSLLTE